MNDYIALLRGINVGSAKQVPMPVLVEAFALAGLPGARTVLRSGNVMGREWSLGALRGAAKST